MHQPKILIVDDEPFNIDYLEQELEDLDFQIVTAANGKEALNKLKSENPDLMLLDIMMPVMDGFDVLTRIKDDPALRNVPVIVISAANSLDSVVRGIQLGAEDYLPKPFEPTLLRARISSCLEKKRLRDIEKLYLDALKDEMQIAHKIQAGFLPTEIPTSEVWDLAVYFKAAKDVAGDFYDIFRLPDGNLVCLVGDVCGKGVGAALFMTLFRSLIRVTCTSDRLRGKGGFVPLSPSERLYHAVSFTNNYVAEVHEAASMFITLFIGIFEEKENKFTYMNCGNEPPLLFCRADGQIKRLTATGPVVGLMPEAQFNVGEISMDTQDVLAAFTDGIPDAINLQDEAYGSDRVKRMIAEETGPSAELCQKMQQDVARFIGEAEAFDDITLMVIKPTL